MTNHVHEIILYLQIFFTAFFYYTLGNLSPKYQSSQLSIQLLIAVKTCFLFRYGADKVLNPVLEEITQLEMVRIEGVGVHLLHKLSMLAMVVKEVCGTLEKSPKMTC